MGKQRILVVDDHKPLLAGIRDILETEDYVVFIATDGVQALQVMEETVCPDLIVSDIMMPGMDGHTLLKRVRARPEWIFIPFVFLTAKAEEEDVLKAKNLGAEGYITKPFTPQELLTTVRACLKGT